MKQFVVIVILAMLLGVVIKDNYEKKDEIDKLKQTITTFNKAERESVKVITKIREVIKNVKEPCNCYNTRVPDDVLKQLHKH